MPEHTNIYETTNWGVHIRGADNVLAAIDFDHAVKKCDEINCIIVHQIKPNCDEHCPIIFAQVGKWEDIATHSHDPKNEDWENLF